MEDAFLMSLQTFHADNDVLGGLRLCAGDVQHFTCVSPVNLHDDSGFDVLTLPSLYWDTERLGGLSMLAQLGI